LLGKAHKLDEALAVVRPFLDPLFRGEGKGSWDPHRQRWTG
jgi:hypothetical protein